MLQLCGEEGPVASCERLSYRHYPKCPRRSGSVFLIVVCGRFDADWTHRKNPKHSRLSGEEWSDELRCPLRIASRIGNFRNDGSDELRCGGKMAVRIGAFRSDGWFRCQYFGFSLNVRRDMRDRFGRIQYIRPGTIGARSTC